MFRVADIRKRTAISPRIRALMYTWGPGHTTAEGEAVPVAVQELELRHLDATLLLPVVVEHTIDERSPLYGTAAVQQSRAVAAQRGVLGMCVLLHRQGLASGAGAHH